MMMVPVIFDADNEMPQTLADVLAQEKADRWCLDLHQCLPLVHGVSLDGLRGLCIYEAPDAEAVRRAVHHLGAPATLKAWTVTPFYRSGYTRAGWPWAKSPLAITFHEFPTDADRERFRSDMSAGFCMRAHEVCVIADFVSLDQGKAVRLYAAPDLEAVRRVCAPISGRDLFAAVAHED
jgi:hypothetical protein